MRRPLTVVALLLVTAAAGASPASARYSLTAGTPWVKVPVAQPAPVGHVIAYVRPGAAVDLRDEPFGNVIMRDGSTTQFGSARAFAVVRARRGRWLAVTDPALGNDRLGWIDARAGGLRFARTQLEVVVSLSSRTLVVRDGAHVLRRTVVGVGRPGSTTPTGRFAITDKLNGPSYSAYYGCCILALSATQPHLPAGWSGGNRIAIHGTPSSSDFGRAVSAGCIHAPDVDLRYMMRALPLGTPVVIRP